MFKSKSIKLIIGIIVLIVLYFTIDIKMLVAVNAIRHFYFFIIALSIPLLISPFISCNRWKILLKAQGITETIFSLIQINFVSVFLGILLPSSIGYDAIRILIIEKRNRDKIGDGGATVIVERFLGMYVLSVIGIIGSIYSVANGGSVNILYTIVLVNIIITLIFCVFRSEYLYARVSSLLSGTNKFAVFKRYFIKIYASFNSFNFKKIVVSILPLIMLFQFSNIICGILIFKAFDITLPIYSHLAFFPLISIISIIPVSISGLGLREGAFVYFYGIIGIAGDISFLVSLIYYFLLMIIPAVIGFIIFVFGPDQYQNIKNELETKDDRKY